MNSLLARLGLGLTLGLVVLFALQWWLVSGAMRNMSEAYVASHLEHDIDNLLGAILLDDNQQLVLNPARINGVFNMPFSGHYYLIRSDEQVLRSRSLWDEQLELPQAHGDAHYGLGPAGQRLLIMSQVYHKHGRTIVIASAEDLTPMEADLAEFRFNYGLVSVLVLVLVILLQAVLVRRGLRPLQQVRDEVVQLEQGEVLRLSESVPSEIKPLVKEFNSLLDVMQERLQRSRTSLGNLAHALKTPLTVLTRMVDSDEMAQVPLVRQQLTNQTEQMRQMMERQLKRARLAGGASPGWQFKPSAELPDLVEVLGRVYGERHIQIETQIPAHLVAAVDREDMLELFGNVLDNACKWARSRVMLKIEDGPGLVFSVEDDGPGCAPELREQLLRRGVRADEDTAGHGLGLAIVQDIVEHYRGSLQLGQSADLGGFAVSVRLPGADVH